MRFVIHIGTHKTGTSSLQTFCTANRRPLLDQGIYYPTNKYASKNFNFLAARIVHDDLDEPRAFLAKAAKQANRKGAHTVLLSAESFYAMHAFFFRLYERPMGDYWHDEKKAIAAFQACLPPGEVEILCYLRRQDNQAESIYNQCVKHVPGFGGTIDEFLPLMDEMLDYAGHLDLWADAFGAKSIQVRSFDQAAPRLLADFLEASVGIRNTGDFTPMKGEVNERLNRDVLEYKRILNRSGMPRYEATSHMLAMITVSEQMGDLRIHQQFLAPPERLKLVERYVDGNDRVQKRFMASEAPTLFPDLEAAGDDTWAPYPGLSVDRAMEISNHHRQITDSPGFRIMTQLRRIAYGLRQRFPPFNEVLNLIRKIRRFTIRALQ